MLRPSGRLFGPRCDPDLLLMWLQQCEQSHTFCHPEAPDEAEFSFRLVHLQSMCVRQI